MTSKHIIHIIKPAFALVGLLAGLTTSHGQSWLTNGLVAYYPFNGNANDASGFANNPAVVTANLTTNRFGSSNAAYSFSFGKSIQYTNQPQIQTTTNVTAVCWMQTTMNSSSFNGLVCKATPSSLGGQMSGWQLGLAGPYVRLEALRGSGIGLNGTRAVNDGAWHLVCGVFNCSENMLAIYVDGQLNLSSTMPSTSATNSSPLLIGLEREQRYPFDGNITGVRIYNRALSAKEVASLYYYESQKQVQLIKYYNLDFDGLLLGRNYQLQASTNLLSWTNWGAPFTATSDRYTNTIPYQRVEDWSKVFFRLQQQ